MNFKRKKTEPKAIFVDGGNDLMTFVNEEMRNVALGILLYNMRNMFEI